MALGSTLHIDGPSETCPNDSILEYHVYATGIFGEKLTGGFGYEVYIDGVYKSELSSPIYSCGTQQDFYINPQSVDNVGNPLYGWNDVGLVELKVFFKGGITCFNLSKTKYITSSVPDPGFPQTDDGGLTFCPGETKLVTLTPGLPGLFNTIDNCFFHHAWDWTVPSGWIISHPDSAGTSNEYSTGGTIVKIKAPASVISGTGGLNIVIIPESPFDDWIGTIQRQITVGPPVNVAISGVNTLCTVDSQFSLQNLPAGSSVSWSVSPTSDFAVTSGTGSTFTTRANSYGNGDGVITASISGACGNAVVNKNIWLGKPKVTGTPFSLVVNTSEGASPFPCISPMADPKVYYWEVPAADRYRLEGEDDIFWTYGVYSANATYYNEGGFKWGLWMDLHSWFQYGNGYSYLSASNTCGPVSIASMGWGMCSGGGYYMVYPNPTTETLYLKTMDEESTQEKEQKVELELIDSFQQTQYINKKATLNEAIDISSLKPGTYYLKVSDGTSDEVHRILIE